MKDNFDKENLDYYGLLPDERKAFDLINEIQNAFVNLDSTHPDENEDFGRHINALQAMLAVRIARRMFPDGWASYQDKKCKCPMENKCIDINI